MLLAELEIWHTRPLTPTRRLALGNLVLPVEPSPGFGGLLLGAVVAAHTRDVDVDLHDELVELLAEIHDGRRVVQPRMRHRYQVDRHGLARSRHRLFGDGEELSLSLDSNGTPMQMVLGAMYALERLDVDLRRGLTPMMRKALAWRGPMGPVLLAHLAGSAHASLANGGDPLAWARDVLGFPRTGERPTKAQVKSHFRDRLREVHPDHGGAADSASTSIADLNEARRILLSA